MDENHESCGKSPGAHIECGESEVKIAGDDGHTTSINDSPKLSELEKCQSSYGLRENPRKTWRIVASKLPSSQERSCKQCGERFWSLRALYGHMADRHSGKDKGSKKIDYIWYRENHIEEAEEEFWESSKRRKLKEIDAEKSANNSDSSTVSETEEEEEGKEVAECLLMLSRAPVIKGIVNSVVVSSDANTAAMEREKPIDKYTYLDGECMDSDSEYFLSAETIVYSAEGLPMNNTSRSKTLRYECFSCKNSYESFLALDRHRQCHKKRPNPYSESKCESDGESLEDFSCDRATNGDDKNVESSSRRKPSGSPFQCAKKKAKPIKNNEAHVCPICGKVFKNSQAYGGHKRSHLQAGNSKKNARRAPEINREIIPYIPVAQQAPEINREIIPYHPVAQQAPEINREIIPFLPDLNLPAPDPDDDY